MEVESGNMGAHALRSGDSQQQEGGLAAPPRRARVPRPKAGATFKHGCGLRMQIARSTAGIAFDCFWGSISWASSANLFLFLLAQLKGA